jgi:NADH-quinone oxidoreductase subunit A
MTNLVTLMLVLMVTGFLFLFVTLMVGKWVRPNRPNEEKGSIYECGEPTIGSSWIQFDLRFYVVALLFVIFDVEMAFLFPWATVFGGANRLNNPDVSIEEKIAIQSNLTGQQVPSGAGVDEAAASQLAIIAFIDLLIFFGILLVGFAYLWKRGDLEWIRSTEGQKTAAEGGK